MQIDSASSLTVALWAAAALAWPASAAGKLNCFDADISAKVVRETPTPMPICDGCIVVHWPWIVELEVRRLHGGAVPLAGPPGLTVLASGDAALKHKLTSSLRAASAGTSAGTSPGTNAVPVR